MAMHAERLVLSNEIAYYPLQDGHGEKVLDACGNLSYGKLTDSFWLNDTGVTTPDFGGMRSSQNAHIEFPDVQFESEFTIALWVKAYWWNDTWGPLFYKGDKSFGVRNNSANPGQLHFLVRDPAMPRSTNLMSDTVLERQRWYHVAVVFKASEFMRIYINGRLDKESRRNIPATIGKEEAHPFMGARGKSAVFAGTAANLHLYGRALDGTEIQQLCRAEDLFGVSEMAVDSFPSEGIVAERIGKDVAIYESGAVEMAVKGVPFRIDSVYSYPQEPSMGFNCLSTAPMDGCEECWNPTIQKDGTASVIVQAGGSKVQVRREIRQTSDGRVEVREIFTNVSGEDQALRFTHRITAGGRFASWRIGGEENVRSSGDGRILPSNSTGFVCMAPDASIGIVAEDDIFRCHLSVVVKETAQGHVMEFGSQGIGIPAGKSHVLRYTLYPTESDDFFDFLNRLRRDWAIPEVTMEGPYDLIRTAAQSSSEYRRHAAAPEEFKRVLERKQMNIITLTPWFNYWDGVIFKDRKEFKTHMQAAMATIRQANPKAKFLASLETYCYVMNMDFFKGQEVPEGLSFEKVTPEFAALVKASPWADSITPNHAGLPVERTMTAVVSDNPIPPHITIFVHPAIGNAFFRQRMEDFDFLLNDVGFDGIYQDMFGFSSPNDVINTEWDGFTVSMNPNGTIKERLTHLGPLTAKARALWLKKILGMNKLALTNFGAPTTREMQIIPYVNFCEAAGRNIGHQDLDAIPPDSSGCAMNMLHTPLAYGPHKAEEINAPELMKRIRSYLRYGCLYVHTSFRNRFPEEDETSGGYGPVNHSFPMTPVELHRGWLKGRERIVSCVSYKTIWNKQERPIPLRFDKIGREISVGNAVAISGEAGAWNIEVDIDDWNEFLILE